MTTSDPLRDQLVRFLDWHEAHVDFEVFRHTDAGQAANLPQADVELEALWQIHVRPDEHLVVRIVAEHALDAGDVRLAVC